MSGQLQLLERIQRTASKDMEAFGKLDGDWMGQMRLYRSIVKRVTKLQTKMTGVFGTPNLRLRPIQKALDRDDPLRATFGANAYIRWTDGLLDMRELERVDVNFRGACIVQAQLVTQLETEAQVDYVAMLKVDENYALERELPSTKSLVVKDPDYVLYRFSIHVPRASLVRESLHAVSNAMKGKKSKQVHQDPNSPFIGWIGTASIGVSPTTAAPSLIIPQTISAFQTSINTNGSNSVATAQG